MNNIICFMSGFGFQELLLIAIFLSVFIGIPVLVILVVKSVLRRTSTPLQIQTTNPPSDSKSSVLRHADQLRELKALQEKGIISAEEFETEKKKILAY